MSSSSSSSLCIGPREQQQSWTGGKHYPEFTHSLAVPAGLQAAPWSLPMGFSIIHQCLHYSLYLLAPGKCCLSWVAQGQCATNTVDTGSVLSPTCCLWGDMHLCVVSAIAGSEIPLTHHGGKTSTSDQDTLGWKCRPSKRDVMLTAQKESQHLLFYVKS